MLLSCCVSQHACWVTSTSNMSCYCLQFACIYYIFCGFQCFYLRQNLYKNIHIGLERGDSPDTVVT